MGIVTDRLSLVLCATEGERVETSLRANCMQRVLFTSHACLCPCYCYTRNSSESSTPFYPLNQLVYSIFQPTLISRTEHEVLNFDILRVLFLDSCFFVSSIFQNRWPHDISFFFDAVIESQKLCNVVVMVPFKL